MLTVDSRNVAIGGVGEMAPHDDHLGTADYVAGEGVVGKDGADVVFVSGPKLLRVRCINTKVEQSLK
jgi:hypothetical protein